MVADEGDMLLIPEVSHQKGLGWPKRMVLISALPKNSWNGTQKLCFTEAVGKLGLYLDASCVFPKNKLLDKDVELKMLPADPQLLVEFAINLSKGLGPNFSDNVVPIFLALCILATFLMSFVLKGSS